MLCMAPRWKADSVVIVGEAVEEWGTETELLRVLCNVLASEE